jgi:hypothetical protein
MKKEKVKAYFDHSLPGEVIRPILPREMNNERIQKTKYKTG